MARVPAPTSTNVFALSELVRGRTPVSVRRGRLMVPPTDAPHLARCVRFGLLAVDGISWRLTETGRAALLEHGYTVTGERIPRA